MTGDRLPEVCQMHVHIGLLDIGARWYFLAYLYIPNNPLQLIYTVTESMIYTRTYIDKGCPPIQYDRDLVWLVR